MGSKFDEVTHGYGSDVWFVFFPIKGMSQQWEWCYYLAWPSCSISELTAYDKHLVQMKKKCLVIIVLNGVLTKNESSVC